ncbi:PREDICTED: uncharacterized protein LOC104378072 [Tauraco erythrolophus]|uniref:uncharacterized protein LOC104378072 n=1 Tax=Tauraco erythrolophus TaxID=121530 RepID=UPI0005234FF1|nr:PREDICTED: uncharacterized protein LOC104378072 [Tauraco erythrolophus]
MRQLCSAAPALLLGTLAVLFKRSLSVDHVPMLLWSTQRSQWNPDTALHEGHIVSAQELTTLLQPAFTQNSRNLILFLQDTLSVDDFTYLSESYGNENPFQNVQEILQSSPSSLVLPAVDCEATRQLLSFLQESRDWKLINTTNLSVSQLEVNTSKPNLLVVQLQPLVRRALQQLHEGTSQIFVIKRTQTSPVANTKKFVGATTGFVACKKGGFLAGYTRTLHKTKPNSTSSCCKSPTELQGSSFPFKGIRDRSNSCPETSGSPGGETRETQQGNGADKVCRRLETWEKGKFSQRTRGEHGEVTTANRMQKTHLSKRQEYSFKPIVTCHVLKQCLHKGMDGEGVETQVSVWPLTSLTRFVTTLGCSPSSCCSPASAQSAQLLSKAQPQHSEGGGRPPNWAVTVDSTAEGGNIYRGKPQSGQQLRKSPQAGENLELQETCKADAKDSILAEGSNTGHQGCQF